MHKGEHAYTTSERQTAGNILALREERKGECEHYLAIANKWKLKFVLKKVVIACYGLLLLV